MNDTENISIILVVLSSAVVSAVIYGLFALFTQQRNARSEQKAWLRDKKFKIFFEIIEQIKHMRTISGVVDPSEVLRLSQQLGLLLEDQKKYTVVNELIIDIYNLYNEAVKSGGRSGENVDELQRKSMELIDFLRDNLHKTK